MHKLLYISRADEIYRDKKKFSALAKKSAEKNKKDNISGALFYSDGYFLQLLEGSADKIAETYLRIKSDTTHQDVQLIPIKNDSSRVFLDWAMSSNWVESKAGVQKIERRLSNFKQAITANKLTSLHHVLEAFFAPLQNPSDNFFKEKIIVVSDLHVKGASFMNWVASNENSKCNHISFNPIGVSDGNLSGDEQLIDYIDISKKYTPQRIVGIETSALGEPSLIPLLSNADKVVLLISSNTDVTSPSLATLSAQHRSLFQNTPSVICVFSKNSENQKESVRSSLSKIGINPFFSELHPNDFKAVWTEITAIKKSEIVINPPSATEKSSHVDIALNSAPSQLEVATQVMAASNQSAQAVIEVTSTLTTSGVINMANIKDSLTELMTIDGVMGCFIADYTSGMLLAKDGGGIDLDIAAAGNTEVIKAKMKAMAHLGIKDAIEDMLITLTKQYHIIRPLSTKPGLFLYVVLDKAKSNLAMARFKLLDVEKTLEV